MHSPASLYEASPPAEAKRIAGHLAIHRALKHGSWLNMVEIELGMLSRQSFDRRIDDADTRFQEAAAWDSPRNGEMTRVN